MHYILGRITVTFVLVLISFIAYSSQIFIIWPWYGSEWSVDLLCLLLPFNALVAILFWNYGLCVISDPGTVPPSWKPDTHSDGYEVKKLTGGPRYCRMCQCYKPPRTHHCRDCDRCVLRMDHHCPWINNCVGHVNYAHFIRFLFYVDVACSYHLAMVSKRVLEAMSGNFWGEPSSTEMIFITMNYVTCVPVLLAVGGFSIYHAFNLLGNSTTIEGWEKDKVATMVRKGQIREVKFPYDLGKRRNIKAVLGPSPLLWCWPQPTPGNGLRFELADFADHGAWPPREPNSVQDRKFELPASPWTYENGALNPSLRPSNARRRSSRNNATTAVQPLPPYHPDYIEGEVFEGPQSAEGSDEDDDAGYVDHFPDQGGRVRVRRGSEGYEVRPQAREEMLRRYMEDLNAIPDRYVRYEPEPPSDSESEEDSENLPLAQAISAGYT